MKGERKPKRGSLSHPTLSLPLHLSTHQRPKHASPIPRNPANGQSLLQPLGRRAADVAVFDVAPPAVGGGVLFIALVVLPVAIIVLRFSLLAKQAKHGAAAGAGRRQRAAAQAAGGQGTRLQRGQAKPGGGGGSCVVGCEWSANAWVRGGGGGGAGAISASAAAARLLSAQSSPTQPLTFRPRRVQREADTSGEGRH